MTWASSATRIKVRPLCPRWSQAAAVVIVFRQLLLQLLNQLLLLSQLLLQNKAHTDQAFVV